MRSRTDLAVARTLLTEYLGLQVDNYPDPAAVARSHRAEVADLQRRYEPPASDMFVGFIASHPAGFVAFRSQSEGIGELTRLYVREELRGRGLGRKLAEAVVSGAARVGYRRLRLDVHVSRLPAIALYESLGFARSEPWLDTEFDLVFMERTL